MPTRNVMLTDDHQKVIDRLVKSGRYQNAGEVLREGLRLIEQRDELEAAGVETLRDAAAIGFSDIENGRFSEVSTEQLERFIARLGNEAELVSGKLRR